VKAPVLQLVTTISPIVKPVTFSLKSTVRVTGDRFEVAGIIGDKVTTGGTPS